jgi:hypothetical protein
MDTLKEVTWGPGNTGFHLGGTISFHRGAIIGKTFAWGSDVDRVRAQEMKAFTIKAAWVRELLEANDWKVGTSAPDSAEPPSSPPSGATLIQRWQEIESPTEVMSPCR